ncbi:MAG: hypothetical protein MZV65_48855 [Chromatiales bacterium]|nr:hypothetical protein [Chromatiales bacterium]
MLVISYNPGYQSVLKELKQSTRQRFVALEFDYPTAGTGGAHRRHANPASIAATSRIRWSSSPA